MDISIEGYALYQEIKPIITIVVLFRVKNLILYHSIEKHYYTWSNIVTLNILHKVQVLFIQSML